MMPNPVRLFHITAIDNLAAICQRGALVSKNAGASLGSIIKILLMVARSRREPCVPFLIHQVAAFTILYHFILPPVRRCCRLSNTVMSLDAH